jgi:hypothetical protein
MGFFRRIRGQQQSQPAWPPQGPITVWPPEPLNVTVDVKAILFDPPRRPIEVIGEGAHQGTLERVAGGRTVDGARVPDHIALLMPEPSNVYDANAVRVVISSGGTIGYLRREDAVAYRPLIDRLAAVGKFVACRASIGGGWDDGHGNRGSFGVRLFLDTPEGAAKEFDADPNNLKPTWEQ